MNDIPRTSGDTRLAIVLSVLLVSAASAAAWGASDPASSNETRFYDENNASMATMMKNMDVAASGNVDRDFATMMIPHHQGAIDMARSELRYGHDERLRRLAQEIVVDQAQEVVVMRTALGRLPHQPIAPVKGKPDSSAQPPARQAMKGTM